MTSASASVNRNPFKGMQRYPDQGYIAGVCEGIARHFDWNVRFVRVVAVVLLVFTGFWPTGVAYLLAWYILTPASSGTTAALPAAAGTTPGSTISAEARLESLERRLRALEAYVSSEEFRLRRELRRLQE